MAARATACSSVRRNATSGLLSVRVDELRGQLVQEPAHGVDHAVHPLAVGQPGARGVEPVEQRAQGDPLGPIEPALDVIREAGPGGKVTPAALASMFRWKMT